MIELYGKYAQAKIFTDVVDQDAISQVIGMLNQPVMQGSRVRMMPDIHAGAGCTVGTTMTVKDRICPGLVGGDIGCGMEVVRLRESEMDLKKLDEVVRANVLSGAATRKGAHRFAGEIDLSKLICAKTVNQDRAYGSIGTLGGGNHFIEANQDEDGHLYIVIHSGSRYLGKEVARYYEQAGGGKAFAYVEGELLEQYLHDMKIAQRYAGLNRQAMMDVIVRGMGLHVEEQFATVHNYIDMEHMVLRKGAVSAQAGERLIIPINMRDGSLICTGKGNEDWNCSAPHGAGRLMSRSQAKQTFTVEEYQEQMAGIYTTSVGRSTLDECPMAYKSMADIADNIGETATINAVIRPIYNFKASSADD
ncbi:MAG: RtcB family protein [Clostridia bacterium]|nr:RtcB family protein [Clostridia bacterium]